MEFNHQYLHAQTPLQFAYFLLSLCTVYQEIFTNFAYPDFVVKVLPCHSYLPVHVAPQNIFLIAFFVKI